MSDRDRLNRAVSAARDLNPYTREFLEHEHETYELLREELPVARSEAMPVSAGDSPGVWVLTRYEDACEILRDTESYSSQSTSYPVRPWIPQAIDPPMHTAYRRILNPWFTVEAMSKLEPRLEALAGELIERMLRRDAFDYVAEFADPFPTLIFCEMAGFPLEDHARIMDWKNTIMHHADGHSRGRELGRERALAMGLEVGEGPDLPREAQGQVRAAAAREVYAYFGELLERRRAEPRDDMVSRLLAARYEEERPLSQEELEDTLFLLFMAGLDTVTSALGLITQTLARDREQRHAFIALMEAPARVGPAVEELVRHHAFVLLPRRVTREVAFHGALFRPEDQVLVPTQSACRDPREFERPTEIDYARTPNRHLAFGLGPHRCLGIHLARREVRIALQVLHRKLPDYALDPGKPPEAFAGMKGLSSLPLVKA